MATSCKAVHLGIAMCMAIDPLHAQFCYPLHPQRRTQPCIVRPTSPTTRQHDRNGLRTGFFTGWGKMTAPLKSIEGSADIAGTMAELGRCARSAARLLALAPAKQKNLALERMATAVREQTNSILAANADDVADARAAGLTGAFLDRLSLDAGRVAAIAAGIDVVRGLKDPVGTVTESWTQPNGMRIERVRVPLGVVAIIYESRPNVTADAGVLCLKAGNAAILRGGSDSMRSS